MSDPGPDDLLAVVGLCDDTLRPLVDRDWTAKAGTLEWTCRQTLEHVCTLAYAPVLATRATEFRPLALQLTPGAHPDQLLWTMQAMMSILAEVARAAPPGARAFHPAGMADPNGFVAMGMDELLVHTSDIANGLHADFEPEASMATSVLDRLFPWWPRDIEPWPALLWANGRLELPTHAKLGVEWLWHSAPTTEWNGTIPRWDPLANRPHDPPYHPARSANLVELVSPAISVTGLPFDSTDTHAEVPATGSVVLVDEPYRCEPALGGTCGRAIPSG